MENQENTTELVTGYVTKHTNSTYMGWGDPETGEECWVQGELREVYLNDEGEEIPTYDEGGTWYAEHSVVNDDAEVIYIVRGELD